MLGMEYNTENPISLIPKEQTCHITIHSISPNNETSYKAFSVLVLQPNTSSLILTQNNLDQQSVSSENEISIFSQTTLSVSHNESWIEVSVFDLNTDKHVLIAAVELQLLEVLRTYHLFASGNDLCLKISVLRIPRASNYQPHSGLEIAVLKEDTSNLSDGIILVEILKSKPLPSYTPSLEFREYSKQQTQTIFLTTQLSIPPAARYSFLSEASFRYRMESHFIVLSEYQIDPLAPWYATPPKSLFYLELNNSTLATVSLIKNVSDTVVYLKGDQSWTILLGIKKKDSPFMTLSSPGGDSPGVVRPLDSSSGDLIRLREEVERVTRERDELQIANNDFRQKFETLQVQHLPSFSRSSLDKSDKSELIHKYLMLQQERDMLSRKCDQSKELTENLYSSLDGFSELQQSYSELEESNLLQQEIVRHLQDRTIRYKKLAKLCQNQEQTILSYEEHFQKLLDSQSGNSVINDSFRLDREFGEDAVEQFTEIEGKSNALVSALQERLLESSLRHRRNVNNNNNNNNKQATVSLIPDDIIKEDLFGMNEGRFVEERNEDRNRQMLTPNIKDIINSIPKLNKMSF